MERIRQYGVVNYENMERNKNWESGYKIGEGKGTGGEMDFPLRRDNHLKERKRSKSMFLKIRPNFTRKEAAKQ